MEFPEVVGEWIESRHVAGAAYVPSPDDPPPPCFGDFCFETFFCGYDGDEGIGQAAIWQGLRPQDGRLRILQIPDSSTTYDSFVTMRVSADGGLIDVLNSAGGLFVLDYFNYDYAGDGGGLKHDSYEVLLEASGLFPVDPRQAAFAVDDGSEVITRYAYRDVLNEDDIEVEYSMRQFESSSRVWYGFKGGPFFFVDSDAGLRSADVPVLSEFEHSGNAEDQLPWFRELLDGRLVLMRVDGLKNCGMVQCEGRWSIVLMDVDTGAAEVIHSINEGPTYSHDAPTLIGDVDGHLVVLERPIGEDLGGDYFGVFLISLSDGSRVELPGGVGWSRVVIDQDREAMVYGSLDGRVYVYDLDTGGSQEWFDLTPGSDGPLAFHNGAQDRAFRTTALVGGRLFVTYPYDDPAPCIYVADVP